MEGKYNKKMQLSPYILAGWLLDGSASPVRQEIFLEFRSDRVALIRGATVKDRAREDFLDLSEHTLLPGLVECHVHLSMSGSGDPSVRQQQLSACFAGAKDTIRKHLACNLCRGVIALRDGGDYGSHVLRYKREFLFENSGRPELKAAGKAWHAPGRYGRLVGRTPYRNCSLAQSIVRGQKHADHVKIVNSGLNSLVDFGKETSPPVQPGGSEKGCALRSQEGPQGHGPCQRQNPGQRCCATVFLQGGPRFLLRRVRITAVAALIRNILRR